MVLPGPWACGWQCRVALAASGLGVLYHPSPPGIGEHAPSVFEMLALAVTHFLTMRVPRVGRPVVWLSAFKEIAPIGALINVCFMTFQGMIAR